MAEKVTMKDIAKEMGVTTTTVHRALQGKEGVSEETRRQVQQVALQMGYRANYMAAALKRKELRIAIALPEPTEDSRFYYGNLWQGVRRFLAEATDFNVRLVEQAYSFVHGANGNALKQIYEQHADELDGLFTMGVDEGQSSYYIEKFAEKNVPIVFVGSDTYKDKRFCCVKSCDEMAGSLAAELLTAFDRDTSPKKVILVGHFGQLGMSDQIYNAMGFDEYLKKHAPHIASRQIRGEDPRAVCYELEQALKLEPDIYAVYSCSARYTIHMMRVVDQLGIKGLRLIGNDCFAESAALLESGALTAIIDKKIARQGYLGMKTLFDYVVKQEYPRSSLVRVRPEVVLRSNLSEDLITGELED